MQIKSCFVNTGSFTEEWRKLRVGHNMQLSKKFLLVWDKVLLVYTGKMLVVQTSDKSPMKQNDKRECLCAHTKVQSCECCIEIYYLYFLDEQQTERVYGEGRKELLTQPLLRGNSCYYNITCFLYNIYHIFHGA